MGEGCKKHAEEHKIQQSACINHHTRGSRKVNAGLVPLDCQC